MKLKTTLEQWNTLIAVEQSGSIQAAANTLNKSHTTLVYAIKKLESQTGVELIQIEGRRAMLTDAAKTLLRRAKPMVEQAANLERISQQISKGWESEILLTIDHLCDRNWLYPAIAEFSASNPGTSVQIRETSLSGTQRAVMERAADLAIVNMPITGFPAEAFGLVTMVLVVSEHHSLASKDRICQEDLVNATQIVVRDTGTETDKQDAGWLKSHQRITVDNFDHALDAVRSGIGFCRVPSHLLRTADSAQLVQLNMLGGTRFQIPVHLVAPKEGQTGPAAIALYDLLLSEAKERTGKE